MDAKIEQTLIDNNCMRENFQKQYPESYEIITWIEDSWMDVPVGFRDDTFENFPKIEDALFVSIYLPNSHKFALINLLQSKRSVCSLWFWRCKVFKCHMDSNYTVPLINLLNNDGRKSDMSNFMITTCLMQKQYGYKMMKKQYTW